MPDQLMRGAGLIRCIRGVDKGVMAPLVAMAALLRPRPRPAPGPARPWVAIKLVGMGDAVLMLPALAALRAAGQTVVVITTRRCAGIFAASGCVDRLICVEWRGALARLRAVRRVLRGCAGVLDFEQHVFWSAALAMLAPTSARRYGYRTVSRTRNRAYDHLVEPGPGIRHMKECFDDLARAAGFNPAPWLQPLLPSPSAVAAVEAWLAGHGLEAGRFLAVAPGSGATVPFRRLDAAAWAQVLPALPAGTPVLLIGADGDAELITEIVRATVPGPGQTLTIGLSFTLEQLAAIFARAAAVAVTDSGPMHLAAAMGVPVAGIFGPDTPRRYAPLNPRSVSVTLELPCCPCNNCWVYREARCTNPDAYACMRRLPPSQLSGALTKLLQEAAELRRASASHGD